MPSSRSDYRRAIADYVTEQARPVDKLGHMPRLYALAVRLGDGMPHDDDVLFAAAWLHDLGVFTGHRPEDLERLAVWDHVTYAMERIPALLERFGFPREKIPAVVEAVRTHLPSREPTTIEGTILRDADLLEQIGAVGILRMASKVGRDTRFPDIADAVRALRQRAAAVPGEIRLERTRELARERMTALDAFLTAAAAELPRD